MTREAALTERVAERARPVSVLFVQEDQGSCASYIVAALRKGWRVDVASSVEDALVRIAADRPDALVVEADFGGALDGFEVARRVKLDPSLAHLPVVVLTDSPLAQVERSIFAAQCSACVPKPCEPDAVIIAVKSVLAIAELLAQRRATNDLGLGNGWWHALR
jgi:two-component system cell cycle response regulator DivK